MNLYTRHNYIKNTFNILKSRVKSWIKNLRMIYIRLGLAAPRTDREVELFLLASSHRGKNSATIFSSLAVVRRSFVQKYLIITVEPSWGFIDLDYDLYRLNSYRWLSLGFDKKKLMDQLKLKVYLYCLTYQ